MHFAKTLSKSSPQVYIDNHQKDLSIDEKTCRSIVRELLSFLNVKCKEISIYFTTKKKISELHEQFFADPTPTDCITFPIDEEFLGEIFICPKVACEYATEHQLDPLKETLLYLVHGILHLIGYDDITLKDRKKMRKMERVCLDHLQQQGLSILSK